jgi:hypothetical protein
MAKTESKKKKSSDKTLEERVEWLEQRMGFWTRALRSVFHTRTWEKAMTRTSTYVDLDEMEEKAPRDRGIARLPVLFATCLIACFLLVVFCVSSFGQGNPTLFRIDQYGTTNMAFVVWSNGNITVSGALIGDVSIGSDTNDQVKGYFPTITTTMLTNGLSDAELYISNGVLRVWE